MRFRLRGDPEPVGTMRLVDAEEAARDFPSVYDRIRRKVPGMFARSPQWWTEIRLADPKEWRRGAGPKFFALYERGGEPEGYTIYRVKHEWQQGIPGSKVQVLEALGVSHVATREIWRFLFGIDLVARVESRFVDPAFPFLLVVEDPRSLRLLVSDGLWLRLVDVEAALRARSYATGDALVLQVHDALCEWNNGRFRVGASVERTDDEPDLDLDVADLASCYLGAFDFQTLARGNRVREARAGALERASALFRTERPPYCPEVF